MLKNIVCKLFNITLDDFESKSNDKSYGSSCTDLKDTNEKNSSKVEKSNSESFKYKFKSGLEASEHEEAEDENLNCYDDEDNVYNKTQAFKYAGVIEDEEDKTFDESHGIGKVGRKKVGRLEPVNKAYFKEIKIGENELLIGRQTYEGIDCKEVKGISRSHAKLFSKNSEFFLVDVNSTNGTFINGEKIEKNRNYLLKDNCKISFAKIDYVFHVED